jgi:hypothetical protein
MVGVHARRFEGCSTFTRITACRLAESPCDSSFSKGSTVSVPPHVALIAAGWSGQDAGWELHPLETNTCYTAHIRSEAHKCIDCKCLRGITNRVFGEGGAKRVISMRLALRLALAAANRRRCCSSARHHDPKRSIPNRLANHQRRISPRRLSIKSAFVSASLSGTR